MIARPEIRSQLRAALRRSRVVALVGPRQCGKTTLARQIVPAGSPNYFDLESADDLARLDHPKTALEPLRGVVVIDEVQHRPELFPTLRVLADRVPLPARFLILGSASPSMLRQTSESLAGRIEVIELSGFSAAEVAAGSLDRLWLRGGFPRSYLARSERESVLWREQFIRSLAERDLPQFGVRMPPVTLLRLLRMLAHYHGQTWNGADVARSLGLSQPTVRHYLDLLTGLFILRQLLPWHENLSKRQVKAPKIYVRDSGLFHALVGARRRPDLLAHPKLGSSWEGFVVEEVMRAAEPDEHYFWATHQGAELDLLLIKDGRRCGVEIKRQDGPRMTPSMRSALEDLRLEHIAVIYPGKHPYRLADRVFAVPLRHLVEQGGDALWRGPAGMRGSRS